MDIVLLHHENDRFRELVRLNLAARNIAVIEAPSVAQLLSLAVTEQFGLALLTMPDNGDCDLYRELGCHINAPILLFAPATFVQTTAYPLRANDAVVERPTSIELLLTRIQQLLRRQSPQTLITAGAGQIVIDTSTCNVCVRGAMVELTQREYALLLALAETPGSLVHTNDLLRRVWNSAQPEERKYVQVYMTHLRGKIEVNRRAPTLIITVGRQGYCLAA